MSANDPGVDVFYYPQDGRVDADGTIQIPANGWAADTAWSGAQVLREGDQEYLFWAWLIGRSEGCKRALTQSEIDELKLGFAVRVRRPIAG